MEGGSIQEGDVIPQTEPLFQSRTHPQIENDPGGFVYKVDDMKRLLRFLIIGAEKTYYRRKKDLSRENAHCVDRLICAGRGVEVVQMIKDISLNRRNVRQNSLLLAYAICARSRDDDTKKAAYELLPEICRIPTHLFVFIKYCEEESQRKTETTGTGWGRAHKRAVCNWYTQFERNPEKLARLITKYKNREKWTHKDVLRLSHTCSEDRVMAFIFSYIIKGYDNAVEEHAQVIPEDEETAAKLREIQSLIGVFEEASRCTQVGCLRSLITEHGLTWEQCNSRLLQHQEVWQALLPHMPIEAMVRNLGRMSRYGIFAVNSEEEQTVVDKINAINTPVDAAGLERLELPEVNSDDIDDERPWNARRSFQNVLHPIKLFFAWTTYKSGHGDRSENTWMSNQRISEALEQAFNRGHAAVESTGKNFYLAVDVSQSMSQPVRQQSNRNISCSKAAAAMIMLTARTESNCIIKAFNGRVEDIDILPTDTLAAVEHKLSLARSGGTDCALPMKDAMDMKRKDIDMFVVYTDNETFFGNVHPHTALCQYRTYSGNKEVKLVVCGMCANEFTIADKDDPFMLDIVGFDSNTPWLISEFARGRL